MGNLLKYSDNSASGPIMGTWTFTYDNLNRLAGSTDNQPKNPSTNYCWSYDSFGNRTTQAGSNAPFATGFTGTPSTNPCTPAASASLVNTWATYAANNQVATTTQAPSGVTHDAAGNVLNDGTTQYLYDAEGRICAAASTPSPGLTIMTGYIYDADGIRVAKGTITAWSCDPGVSGFTTVSDYVLGPGGEQVAEYGAGPASGSAPGAMAWQHSNVYAAGKLLATYDNVGLHFYLDDPLGSRRVQTDYAGVTEQTCSSLPFGDSLACTGSTQFPTEHHFTGKERDVETGNDYFGARYYSSAMGRFLSPDWSAKIEPVPYSKLDDPQTLSLYAYVNNNPLTGVDPDGHGRQPNLTDRFGCSDGEYCDGSSQLFDSLAAATSASQEEVNQQQSVAAQCPGCGDMNSAGAAAEKAALPLTQASVDAKDYHEYGGYILESKSNPDQFTYSKPLAGKETLVDIDNIKAPKGYKVVGEYHTHPRGPGDNREGFSTRDGNRYNGNGRVGYVADNNTRRMYVFVPGLTVNHPEWERTGDFVQKIP